jgi:crotonobetainyl-CoA:carnitine CoA-transferase CaiB-like acyl-CoA transferase
VVADEYLRRRGALREVDDGLGGTFTLPANMAWPDNDGHLPRVPRLGEQRDAVLQRELRMTAEDIDRLERSGAFGPSATAAAQAERETAVAAFTN